ncbi:hypothetical protein [Marinomonas sp. GJ51-6]|nr:hypothetical protein [Marinomonas sp. GJ51-6]WOD06757.1 hypothetical protein ONZ50_13985 [Marinomonas sp. GJ51-6]
MKMIKLLARPVFFVVLSFSVTACVFMPGELNSHGGSHGGGAAAGHK